MVVDYIGFIYDETDTSTMKKKIYFSQTKTYENIGKNKLPNVLQCVIDTYIFIFHFCFVTL